jgi:hypothetical protein
MESTYEYVIDEHEYVSVPTVTGKPSSTASIGYSVNSLQLTQGRRYAMFLCTCIKDIRCGPLGLGLGKGLTNSAGSPICAEYFGTTKVMLYVWTMRNSTICSLRHMLLREWSQEGWDVRSL